MSDVSFYRWRSKYGGMALSDIRRLKDLEKENNQLKQMFATRSEPEASDEKTAT